MRGPAQQYWYLVKDSFEVVDGMDTTYHQQLYQLEYPSPVAVAGLRLAAYLGNKGLEGLFAAADVSIFRTIQGVRFYPGWASEQAVKHIGGGDVPLPQYASNYGIILAPHVGYRLIVKGFALEAGVGYMAMSHELGNGISIHLGAGYALGKE
jgi:hypothetical protein